MKLFLSSYRISNPDKFAEFVGKKLKDIKIGLIFNSKDCKPVEIRQAKLDEHLDYYKNLGVQIEEIDLREYSQSNDVLKKFSEFDVIWLNGGNTYCLRLALAESGADKVLLEALVNGIVYGGDSAGAIIAGPTLKYFDAADDISVVSEAIYDGLGLTDIAILPHWASEEYGHVLSGIEEKLKSDGYKTMRLRDEEYVMIEDGQITTKTGPLQ